LTTSSKHRTAKALILFLIAIFGLIVISLGIVPLIRGPLSEPNIVYERDIVTLTHETIGRVRIIVVTEDEAFVVKGNAQFIVMVFLYKGVWTNNETIPVQIGIIDLQGNVLELINAIGGRQSEPEIYYYWGKTWFHFDSEGFIGVKLFIDSSKARDVKNVYGTSEGTTDFSFPAIVNIRPYSYLDQRRGEYQTRSLAFVVLGLSIISVIPAFDRLIDSWDEILEMVQRKSLRLAGSFGIISPILTFILIGLAISQASSWFSWTGNALSDLGVHEVSAALFNVGLIIGGILNTIFAFGVIQFYRNQTVGKDGAFFLLLAGIFLTSIGVFPENSPNNIHYIVSVAFFSTLSMSFLIQAVALIQTPANRRLGILTLIIALTTIIPWAIWLPLKPYQGVAIPELISTLAAATWSITMGIRMLQETRSMSA
jgi:hypothetical membrane protein